MKLSFIPRTMVCAKQHGATTLRKQTASLSRCIVSFSTNNSTATSFSTATASTVVADDNEEYDTDECNSEVLLKSSSTSNTKYTPIYVAATRQHVGKTSVSLALMSGLQKRFQNNVGFIKPVGQHSLTVSDNGESIKVDKDAVLMKQHFQLNHLHYRDTSPVLIPAGYTKDYLDGKHTVNEQYESIMNSYNKIQKSCPDMILCEGTGHSAVGSIVDANNANVAAWLNASVVLVANGGIGQCFDDLQLNYYSFKEHNVPIAGVIVNKIKPDKYEQTKLYLSKALQQKWNKDNIPLLGCIPDRPFLGCPALVDLERLFGGTLVSGTQHRLRHYRVQDLKLVATSLEVFLRQLRLSRQKNNGSKQRTLFVCHASRNDILLGYLMESVQRIRRSSLHTNSPILTENWETAMVVTGCDEHPISTQVLEIVTNLPNFAPPVLLTGAKTDDVINGIYQYTPKLNVEDNNRVGIAIDHYEPYINFDLLLQRCIIQQQEKSTASSQ